VQPRDSGLLLAANKLEERMSSGPRGHQILMAIVWKCMHYKPIWTVIIHKKNRNDFRTALQLADSHDWSPITPLSQLCTMECDEETTESVDKVTMHQATC
jgi:hypothetical protein